MGDSQLYRVIVSVEVGTSDVQDRLARLAVYELRQVRRGKHGSNVLASSGHREREDKSLQRPDYGTGAFRVQSFGLQALAYLGRKMNVSYDERNPLVKPAHDQN
jgi:hypothetical protein